MNRIIGFTVEPDDAGRKLEVLLRERLGLTRAQISRAKFTEGGITVNGTRRRVTYQAAAGDRVEVAVSETTVSKTVAASGDRLQILYEDEDVLAVCKPPGTACHPAHGHYLDTLANQAAAYLAEKGSTAPIREVGRLDRDTSGIVVFAKNHVAAARLSAQREERAFCKLYLAAAEGVFEEPRGCVRLPLAPAQGELNRMKVSSDGKTAVTYYRVISQRKDHALVCCRLMTGRTHQIRVHLAALGHPLLGDVLYGRGADTGSRLGLHAAAARFFQPFAGKEICLAAELENDPVFGTIDSEMMRRELKFMPEDKEKKAGGTKR